MGILGVVLVFYFIAGLYPVAVAAGSRINQTGVINASESVTPSIPLLSTFFGTSGGVGWIIMGALLLVGIIAYAIKAAGHKVY